MTKTIPFLIVVAIGCTSAQQSRQACYAKHEAAAWDRAERECPGGGEAWDNCPARQRILAELAENYRRCE